MKCPNCNGLYIPRFIESNHCPKKDNSCMNYIINMCILPFNNSGYLRIQAEVNLNNIQKEE